MNKLKKVLLVISCLGLIGSCAGLTLAYTVTGNPTLLYDGKEKSLTLLDAEGTDLFSDMKDLMPGDMRTQEISLQTENLEGTASIWLKVDCDAQTAQVLQRLTLSVYADGRLVSSGPAGGEALEKGVELYEFTGDRTVPLRVELEVPVQVGNELADAREHWRWTFTVQDVSGTEVVPPQTGDDSRLLPWIVLLVISSGMLVATLLSKIQKRKIE